MSRLQLFSYFRSSAAFRVRIALQLKKIPYDYRPIHLLKDGGEQNKAAYQNLNPMGEVPAIVDDGFALGQSMAILIYLDQKFAEPRLFPTDPAAFARVVQICEIVNSGMHPLQNLKVQQELESRFGASSEAKLAWTQHWIQKGFISLEKILATTAGTYAFGGQVTAADLFIVPQTFSAKRFKCEMGAFPIIQRVTENCMKLEAFQNADPAHQPDTPADGQLY